jgi:hypothetical protein
MISYFIVVQMKYFTSFRVVLFWRTT